MTCIHCKGNTKECGGKTFLKYYSCDCGVIWATCWCAASSDHCPQCKTETEPAYTEEMAI